MHKVGSFDGFLFEGEHFADLISRFPETFPTHLRGRLGISSEPKRFDSVLMGRSTYEVGLRQGIASPYAHLRQYVVSTTMPESPHSDVQLSRHDPLELARSLKREHGMDVWICGGAKLASALAREIDELILKINPVVFGSGIRLFDGLQTAIPTILRDQKRYPNGFVLAHYDLVGSQQSTYS